MARSKQDSLLSLPYVELIDGKTYVRLMYFNEKAGRRRSKTRRVYSVDDYARALQELKREIGSQPEDYVVLVGQGNDSFTAAIGILYHFASMLIESPFS